LLDEPIVAVELVGGYPHEPVDKVDRQIVRTRSRSLNDDLIEIQVVCCSFIAQIHVHPDGAAGAREALIRTCAGNREKLTMGRLFPVR